MQDTRCWLEEVEGFLWTLVAELFYVTGEVAADAGYCAGFGDQRELLGQCELVGFNLSTTRNRII